MTSVMDIGPPRVAPIATAPIRPPFIRRHRRALRVMVVLVGLLVGAGAVFVWEWNHSGPGQLSGATALHRFRLGGSMVVSDPGALHPRSGVYSYVGTGSDHVSVPPKTITEGPRFPGTVSYLPDGCWVFRVDYSDSHWQSNTYCARGGTLVEVGRAGWYRWNFVALQISDTATFTCGEMAIPSVLRVGEQSGFACSGRNDPLNTGTVTMTGTTQYLGTQTMHVGGSAVLALHFRESARFEGGQSGSDTTDTWVSTVDGLPLRVAWSETVNTPSPLGTSTMTGRASFTLTSLVPRS